MSPKDLKKGALYRYTAGLEPVTVEFIKWTINGYVFVDGHGVEQELHLLTVLEYVEEMSDDDVIEYAGGRMPRRPRF